MARSLPTYGQLLEEDYIDMDISSSTTFLCYTITSPPQTREFEFHLSTNPVHREPTTSPADELFYKGKLLPLHLPPRLQMVQKLLDSSNTTTQENPAAAAAAANAASNTPFESCNISPSSSCYVSGELNPEDYYECSAGFARPLPKKTWSKKLKLIRQCSLGLKLKASRAYLKSLFTKSAGSDELCAVPKVKQCSNDSVKAGEKNPFGQIRRERFLMADTVMEKNMDKE